MHNINGVIEVAQRGISWRGLRGRVEAVRCKGWTPLRNSNFAKRVYKPALKRLGLPDTRIHDLRHTAVSVAKSVGGDIFDAKNQVGHSDIRTTINIYGHIFEEDSPDLAQKLDIALKNVH